MVKLMITLKKKAKCNKIKDVLKEKFTNKTIYWHLNSCTSGGGDNKVTPGIDCCYSLQQINYFIMVGGAKLLVQNRGVRSAKLSKIIRLQELPG